LIASSQFHLSTLIWCWILNLNGWSCRQTKLIKNLRGIRKNLFLNGMKELY